MEANAQDGRFIKGISDLSGVLNAIPAAMRSEILERAVERACKPIEVAAKRFAKRSERTGALRESITTKTVNYNRDGKAVGLVGPDRNYYVGRKKAGKLAALYGVAERPSKYAHLVEYGHNIAKGGTLRPTYKIARVGTGKFSKSGKEIKGIKRVGVAREAKGIVAGWVPAKPFIRPAVVTTTSQQSEQFYAGIASGFEAARRAGVRSGAMAKYKKRG